jgi:GNAT superfamily N-acetyltransferase
MQYRVADESDVTVLAEMRWEFQTEDVDNIPVVRKAEFIEACIDFLKQGLIQKYWVYWVADLEGEIISHIFVQRVRGVPSPAWLNNAYGYVTNVYTKPAHRRQGIGTALMQQVLNWAKQQEIDVLIVSPSEKSVVFYERAGFTTNNEWMELTLEKE